MRIDSEKLICFLHHPNKSQIHRIVLQQQPFITLYLKCIEENVDGCIIALS